ncbi:MAG: hypothetical protein LBJ86_05930, partial [Spirochaetaceae bacterium]|nr:hypothetical protein [Spirochaetaceae bacterium]
MEAPNPAENVRDGTERLIVYPVCSRRAGGLSIGINLYPDKKCCNFDCKYCEVFPFSGGVNFSLSVMESGLRKAIAGALSANTPVRDISFSGSGEPTLSGAFAEALRAAASVRDGFDWPNG